MDNLRAGVEALEAKKAVGVEGVTTAVDGQDLAANRPDLPRRRPQRAYRPKAVRRVESPKEDGSTRPLGLSCVADNSVQEMVRRLWEGIDAPGCIDTSDGCRPGRSGHDARRQLNHEVMSEPGNGLREMALAKCFDTMPHTEIRAGLAERLADQKVLRLIARRLNAGVHTPGGVGADDLGSPQGSMVSPVIAKALLDSVLDQWCVTVVRQPGRGDGALICCAADALVVVEREDEARRVWRLLP